MSSWQEGSKNLMLKHRLQMAVFPVSRCVAALGSGTSLCSVADNSVISSVAAFQMPTLVTAGLFNFHYSEVFNLSAVSFCSVEIKCPSPHLDFYSVRAGAWILYEQTVISSQDQGQDQRQHKVLNSESQSLLG